eukprot:1162135-Pelagomonas_calceolata.AAC.4
MVQSSSFVKLKAAHHSYLKLLSSDSLSAVRCLLLWGHLVRAVPQGMTFYKFALAITLQVPGCVCGCPVRKPEGGGAICRAS